MDLNCKFIFLSPLPKIARQNISSAVFLSAPALENNFSARRRLFRSLRSAQSSFRKRPCSQITGGAGRNEFLIFNGRPASAPHFESPSFRRKGLQRQNVSSAVFWVPAPENRFSNPCRLTFIMVNYS